MKTNITLELDVSQIEVEVIRQAAWSIQERIGDDIEREVRKQVVKAVDEQVNQIVKSVLEREFTPVDQFGDAKGDPTSVKEIISKKAESFLSEVVDGSGKKADHYSSTKQPRTNYILGQLVSEAINTEAKNQIKVIAEQAKGKAMQQVAELLVKQLSK